MLFWFFVIICYGIFILPKSYAEALMPNVIVFEDRAYKDVAQVKWDQKGGASIG